MGFLFYCIGLYVCLYGSTIVFDYCSFTVNFEIRECEISNFGLFFKTVLTTWGPLSFHIRMDFSIVTKISTGKLHPFKVYNSVVISAVTDLCNSHHYLVPEHFQLPKKKPIPVSSHSLLSLSLSPKKTSVCFLSQTRYVNRIIPYVLFCDWLISLSVMFCFLHSLALYF